VKSDLVWRVGIVKRPSAATVNQMSVFVCLARPQSRDPARLAVLSPQRRVDPVVRIERRNDDISKAGVTFGMPRFACKLDTDLPKLRRKGCIQDRLEWTLCTLLVYRLETVRPPAIISALPRCLPPRQVGRLPAFSGS
jgi:hypothetical protein